MNYVNDHTQKPILTSRLVLSSAFLAIGLIGAAGILRDGFIHQEVKRAVDDTKLTDDDFRKYLEKLQDEPLCERWKV